MAKNAPATARRRAILASTALVLALITGLLTPVALAPVSAARYAIAQAGDFPDSVSVASQTFVFDRAVPLAEQDLNPVGEADGMQIFARDASGPFDAVYVSDPGRAEQQIARYLPSGPDVSGDCRAQAADIPTATANGETYAFAGFEEDVQTADLQSLADTEIAGEAATLYGASDASGGLSEFFAETSQGLYRFVQLDGGVPTNLPAEVPFGDQTLTSPEASELDVSTLNQVGCVGAYPAYAPEASGPFSEVVIEVGGAAVSFTVAAGEAAAETPTEAGAQDQTAPPAAAAASPTEVATEAPVEATTPAEETPTTQPTTASDTGTSDQSGLLSPGRPDRYPLAVTVQDQDYLFSRLVTIDVAALDQLEEQEGLVIYGGSGDALFVTAQDSPEGQAARYMPIVFGADATCPVEALNVSQPFVIDEIPYAFAGIEETLTTDDLQFLENYSVQVSGQQVDAYAAPDAGSPLPEIFLDTDSGLLRFVSLAENGVPTQLQGTIPFGGQTLSDAQASDADPASLAKVGCLGEFPTYAEAGETEPPFSAVYAVLSGTVVEFQVEGGAPTETAVPTEAATPTTAPTETLVPTETPVPNTETPIPTETAVPATDTPVPTETAVPATETPAPTETEVPTETLVPETETPAATETAVPATDAATATEPAATGTVAPSTETAVPTGTVGATEPAATEASSSETVAPTTEAPTEAPPPAATEAVRAAATRVLAPVAVVPTLAAEAPPPAAATAEPRACSGSAGDYNARGLPTNLPSRIQLGGIAYNFVQIEDPANAGQLTRIGCVGPFTAGSSDQAPQDELLYLRYDDAPEGRPALFRYEAGTTFSVQFEVTGNPQVLASADQSYRVAQTWQQVAYSSVTVILYAPEGADLTTSRFYARRIDASVIGEYVAENDASEISDAVNQDAATYELNTDLIIGGNRYVLVAIWTPSGTTTNGFVTLFAPRGVDAPDQLLGVNPLRPGLSIYQT